MALGEGAEQQIVLLHSGVMTAKKDALSQLVQGFGHGSPLLANFRV
jgi:hypothetical protein